jgi:hypothetical protein
MSEAEIGLVARPHHAHEFARAIRALEADPFDLDRAFGLGRGRRIGFAAGENEKVRRAPLKDAQADANVKTRAAARRRRS